MRTLVPILFIAVAPEVAIAQSGEVPVFLREKSFSCADIANAVNHYVALGEEKAVTELILAANRADPDAVTQVRACLLCRILFEPKAGKPLRPPILGVLAGAFDDAKRADWPLYPLAKSGKSHFLLDEGYYGSGRPERAFDYVHYCKEEGKFLAKPIPVPCREEAVADLKHLQDSDQWKASKWIGILEKEAIASLSAQAEKSPAAAQNGELTYWQDIRPILRKHCIVCHSASKLRLPEVSAGLALDTYDLAMKGSKQAVIVAGKSDKSRLVELVVSKDPAKRMPLDADPLSKEKIDAIKKWIDSGAKEGKKPDEIATAPTTKKTPTRKLDITIPTAATLNKAKLELALKVGPLAPVTAVAFSPDNKQLAVGSYGQVVIWDMHDARPVKLLTNVLGAVNDLRYSPKGEVLAVAGGQPSAKGDLRLYQTSDWKLLGVMRGHDDVVFSVAFSPDGSRIASASFDHSVRLWNAKTHEPIKEFHHHSDFVYAVAFSPDGKQLASASKDRTVQLFDAETGKSVFTYSGMEQDVMTVAFHPDGKSILSSGFESTLWWWNRDTGENIKKTPGHGIATHELAISKDGKRIVSAGADRSVKIYDGAGAVLKTLPVGSPAYSVAISPNGKYVAGGAFDGMARVWDESTGRHLVTLLGVADADDQLDWLAITPEGYAASSDKLMGTGRWRANAKDADGPWKTLRSPETVARAMRGEAVAVPALENK